MPIITDITAAVSTSLSDDVLIVQSGVTKIAPLSLLLDGYQTQSAALAALAAVSANGALERTGTNTYSSFTVSAAAKTLLDDASTSAMRTTLGLGTAAVVNVPASGDAASGEVVKGNDSRLTDTRTPAAHTQLAATITDLGTCAILNVPASGDASSTQVVKGNDTRLSNARTPSAHAATHATGQSDAITPGSIGAAASSHTHTLSSITDAGSAAGLVAATGGNAIVGQVVTGIDTRLSDARTPTAHASSHASGGSDPITALALGGLVAASNLSDLASAATARTNLGLGTIATQAASAVAITGGTIAGITDLAVADGGTGASTAAAALTNLGAKPLTGATTLLEAATITLDSTINTRLFNVTLTGNRTLDITGNVAGRVFRFKAKASGGAYSITTWDTDIIWAAGTPPTQTATDTKSDLFEFTCTGSKYIGAMIVANLTE
jgi:hypothetical protein